MTDNKKLNIQSLLKDVTIQASKVAEIPANMLGQQGEEPVPIQEEAMADTRAPTTPMPTVPMATVPIEEYGSEEMPLEEADDVSTAMQLLSGASTDEEVDTEQLRTIISSALTVEKEYLDTQATEFGRIVADTVISMLGTYLESIGFGQQTQEFGGVPQMDPNQMIMDYNQTPPTQQAIAPERPVTPPMGQAIAPERLATSPMGQPVNVRSGVQPVQKQASIFRTARGR